MAKGLVIGLLACGALMLLVCPFLIVGGVVLYESKTVKGDQFKSVNGTYVYTFEDIGPGKLEFDIEYDNNLGDLHATVTDGKGNVIKDMDAHYRMALVRPNYFIYNTTELTRKDDYTITVWTRDYNFPDLFDTDLLYIKVKFKGRNNGLASVLFVCSVLQISLGFWLTLISGIVLLIRRKKERRARGQGAFVIRR